MLEHGLTNWEETGVGIDDHPPEPHWGDYILYFRVSTGKQGDSGLGLEAQEQMCLRKLNGGKHRIIARYQEVETGRASDKKRPELRKALEHCRSTGATLMVASLDRLTRKVEFFTQLIGDSSVKIEFADFPYVASQPEGRFALIMLANIAELEAANVSARTKRALAAKKARGETLGPTDAIRELAKPLAAQAHTENADEFAMQVGPIIQELREFGAMRTYRELARGLRARGVLTVRGREEWTASSVRNCELRWRELVNTEEK